MNRKLFKRIFRSGLTLVKRNGVLGASSIVVMIVTLTVILGMFFSQALLDASIKTVESRIDVTIRLSDSANDETIAEIKKELEAMPEIKNVDYISKEEALVLYRERHGSDDLALQAINEIGRNPLPASFVIHAKDTAHYENIIATLEANSTFLEENKSFITRVNFGRNKDIINRILVLRDGVKRFGYVLTLIFILIALLVTFNTTKLATYTMKDEIEVMRLVGARSIHIRGPFIVAQIIYSLIAALITLIIFLGITYILRDSLAAFFGVDLFLYYLQNILQISFIVIFSGVILAFFSSLVSVSKYLKK